MRTEPRDYLFTAKLVNFTSEAYLVQVGENEFGQDAPRYWLPKSQTTDNEDGTFSIPEWLAVEKGLE